jgi:hypothetical protein
MAQSGHPTTARQCLLLGSKRTSLFQSLLSRRNHRATQAGNLRNALFSDGQRIVDGPRKELPFPRIALVYLIGWLEGRYEAQSDGGSGAGRRIVLYSNSTTRCTSAASAPCRCADAWIYSSWFWAGFACPASIILSGIVADFRDNRELTTAEAWTCGLLYWIPMPYQPKPVGHHH